jgi:hypothetical protein
MNVPHLHLVPSVDAVHDRPRRRFSDVAPFPIAVLAVAASIIRSRGIAGMLWVDVVAAAGLCVANALALRGSRRGRIVVASLLLYLGYAFAIHAVATPFGAMFLVHCATLGASAFALVDLGSALNDERAWTWFDERAPHRITAVMLIACSGVLGALWLGRTAPVHSLDIALALPALVVVGVNSLRRSSPAARVQAAMLLGFAGAMTAAIAASLVGAGYAAPIAMSTLAVASIGTFAVLVACVTGARRSSAR